MSLYDVKKYREERAGVIKETQDLARKIKEEERQANAEECETFDRLDNARKDLDAKIRSSEHIERSEELTVEVATPQVINPTPGNVITRQDKDNALKAWMCASGGTSHMMQETWKDAAHRCGVDLHASSLTLRMAPKAPRSVDEVTRAGQIVGTDASGGYFQNDAVVKGLETYLLDYNHLRSAVKIVRTDTNAPLRWVTLDDTTTQAAQISELTDSTSDDLAFGEVVFQSYSNRTNCFPVSYELLMAGSMDVGEVISEALGTRLGRKQAADMATGDGTAKPEGIVIGASDSSVNTDSTSTIVKNNLIDLYFSVNAAYRRSKDCYWGMNDNVMSILCKLDDSNGLPLVQPGLLNDPFDKILGKPVMIIPEMDDCDAASKKPVIFGDFGKYILREVRNYQVVVAKERYIDKLAWGYFGFGFWDGALTNTAAVKYMATS